jgi:hypothetical protein
MMPSRKKPDSPPVDCKLKRVDTRLPLHVHSAGQERFARQTAGNPVVATRTPRNLASKPQWTADSLAARLKSELSVEAWRRLEAVARRLGTDVQGILAQTLG